MLERWETLNAVWTPPQTIIAINRDLNLEFRWTRRLLRKWADFIWTLLDASAAWFRWSKALRSIMRSWYNGLLCISSAKPRVKYGGPHHRMRANCCKVIYNILFFSPAMLFKLSIVLCERVRISKAFRAFICLIIKGEWLLRWWARVKLEHHCVFYGEAAKMACKKKKKKNEPRHQEHLVRGSSQFY